MKGREMVIVLLRGCKSQILVSLGLFRKNAVILSWQSRLLSHGKLYL